MNRESERKRLVELIIKSDVLCHTCGENSYSYCAEAIADHILDNGIVVPPVKVGQTVWLIKSLNWQRTEWGIKEGKISMIMQKADKSWKFRVTENHSVQDYTVDAIGKTVFTSREDAVNALKGKEQNG